MLRTMGNRRISTDKTLVLTHLPGPTPARGELGQASTERSVGPLALLGVGVGGLVWAQGWLEIIRWVRCAGAWCGHAGWVGIVGRGPWLLEVGCYGLSSGVRRLDGMAMREW